LIQINPKSLFLAVYKPKQTEPGVPEMNALDVSAIAAPRGDGADRVVARIRGRLPRRLYLDHPWCNGECPDRQSRAALGLRVGGKLDRGAHFVPPLIAFVAGVFVAAWLHRAIGERAGVLSLLIEVLVLIAVGAVHNYLSDLAGTLGISLVAAIQTSIFTKVEGATYSSVMATSNLHQAIEGTFVAACGGSEIGVLRRSGIFAGLCVCFGVGAAASALVTKHAPSLALGIPVITLLLVFFVSEREQVSAKLV
jgi:uncharacterized membrane protein YoaK (UPF0700 family)